MQLELSGLNFLPGGLSFPVSEGTGKIVGLWFAREDQYQCDAMATK